jgi:hypothetical protein
MGLDAYSVIIQFHLFLAFCLAVAGAGGALIRGAVGKHWLPACFAHPEFAIIGALVVMYVFGQVVD